MSVQWFPGHMHLTRQAIAERVKSIDVVIEMLDARLPGSSANPLLTELTSGRPTLKVLNKQDMADPERTALWLAHYNAQPNTRAIALDASHTSPAKALMAACAELAPLRGGMVKPMRILICGIPNVGKSTLINALVGKRSAKTGDEAGVTRNEQRIALADDVYLFDTPGMLWPRIVVPESGFNLAASGAVGRNAYDDQEVALELLARQPGRRFAVLGSMLELGEQSVALHRQVAERAATLGLDGLVVVAGGIEAQAMAAAAQALPRLAVVAEPAAAAEPLKQWLASGDVLLLKASRGVALERLIPLLPELPLS